MDFDLEDQELEFDPALVNLYKRELAGFTLGDRFTSEAVADVRHRLKGVYNQFESLTVEVKEAMVRSQGGIELVVKAFDKKGRPFLGLTVRSSTMRRCSSGFRTLGRAGFSGPNRWRYG